MSISPYPLAWPEHVARTPATRRLSSPFHTKFDGAVQNVANSLRLFQKEAGVKIEHVVLSSNVDLLCQKPLDPGAAAWFMMDNQWMAFGVDRFALVEANIQAIHHIIEARRVELRYGGLAIMRQTFRSFVALPAPDGAKWWEVLQIPQDADVEAINRAFRRCAEIRHPDKGGSNSLMAELNKAREQALRART